ncbi:MAG: phage holin family protein [Oscillospiraceae bacterium]|jgi:uncharacterized protein YjeT (DUF2065 family)|nr:phage holin family protein [Oscillospiraceae bacterium]
MNTMLTIIWYALLAILGACARHLYQHGGSRPREAMRMVGGCMVSAFAGVMIYFVTHALNVGQDWAFALAGIGGWIGPQFLDLIANLVSRQVGAGDIIRIPQIKSVRSDEDNAGDNGGGDSAG